MMNNTQNIAPHLIMFYGTDCPHCENMKILINKFAHDYHVMITMRDVWKSETDYRMMENYIQTLCPDCPGIPFFINTQTNQFLCGEVSYKKFYNWAIGGNVE